MNQVNHPRGFDDEASLRLRTRVRALSLCIAKLAFFDLLASPLVPLVLLLHLLIELWSASTVKFR